MPDAPDPQEFARTAIQYLEVGRAVFEAAGALTPRHADLIERAIAPLAIMARGDPPAPSGPISIVPNVR